MPNAFVCYETPVTWVHEGSRCKQKLISHGSLGVGSVKCQPPSCGPRRLGFEDVAATAFILGEHGSILSLLVKHASRFILFHNDSAHIVQRRYLPTASHCLGFFNPWKPLSGVVMHICKCLEINAIEPVAVTFETQRWFQNGMWKITFRFQYNTQNFQKHFNYPLLQRKRKRPSSSGFKGGSQN
jgi:hypothetical protein